MKEEIRTFVAIKIQAEMELIKQLVTFSEIFEGERINWVSEDNLHLTLRFIGNTNRKQLYELVDRLEALAKKFDSFELVIKGADYFSSKGKPRVLFVKVNHSTKLVELVRLVEKDVVECGFHPELKPFIPHLTLGRIKHLDNRSNFLSIVDEQAETPYQKVTVSEFILYQSILKTEGPIYKPIKIFHLK